MAKQPSGKPAAALPPAAVEGAKRLPAAARRQQILQAAIRLFAQRGFRGTTTKEIALAAGVNEALIFRYYATKEELYNAILDFKASEAGAGAWIAELEVFTRRRDDDGLFAAVAGKLLDHYGHDREFLHLMFYSALEGHDLARMFGESQALPLKRFLRDYITLRQREGVFAGGCPDAAVLAFIAMPSHYALVKELLGWETRAVSNREAVSTFTRIFLDGLRHRPASRRRRKPNRKTKD